MRSRTSPIRLRLPYQPPLDLDGLIAFLGRRAVAGLEEILPEGGYRRSVRLPRGPGVIELRPARKLGDVEATFRLRDHRDLGAAVRRSRKLLDLDRDPGTVTAALGDDPVIGPLVRAAPGRRVPGHVDPFELAIRAVLGQQISVAAATTHASRIVATYGDPLDEPLGAVTHLFPTAAALAAPNAAPLTAPTGAALAGADGAALALPAARRRTLTSLAGAVAAGELRLGHDGRPGAALAIAERWRPYRAYAVQHLWAAAP